jgi:hypothetical protein
MKLVTSRKLDGSGPEMQSFARYLLDVGVLLGLIFDPEDVSEMFLRNVG